MKIIRIRNNKIPKLENTISCIGYFDAFHLGHQTLIEECKRIAHAKNLKTSLITFDPDPIELISGIKTKHIFTDKKRHKLASLFGIDYLYVISFDDNLMRKDSESFIKQYLNKMSIDTLICGSDFRFAYQGKGRISDLKKYGCFDLKSIKELVYYGKKISSSRIKNSINKGNFRLVDRMLGFDYSLSLKCTNNLKKGSKYLIEAVSSDDNILIPKDGIYSCFNISNNMVYILSDTAYKKNDIFDFYPE